jgi:hypothetical protein
VKVLDVNTHQPMASVHMFKGIVIAVYVVDTIGLKRENVCVARAI